MKCTNPTTSLRIAFWTLISASSLYWMLAILLLSSCSGSVFKDTNKKNSSDGNGETSGNRVSKNESGTTDQAEPKELGAAAKKPSRKSKGAPKKETATKVISEKERAKRNRSQKDQAERSEEPRGRSVTNVPQLELYSILFPNAKPLKSLTKDQLDLLILRIDFKALGDVTGLDTDFEKYRMVKAVASQPPPDNAPTAEWTVLATGPLEKWAQIAWEPLKKNPKQKRFFAQRTVGKKSDKKLYQFSLVLQESKEEAGTWEMVQGTFSIVHDGQELTKINLAGNKHSRVDVNVRD